MGRRWGDFGLTGFYEEMPAILLVVVGTGIFLASSMHAYGDYVAGQRSLEMQAEAGSFADAILEWNGISGGTSGTLDAEMLDGASSALIIADFPPDALGFEYQVAFLATGPAPIEGGGGAAASARPTGAPAKVLASSEPPLSGDVWTAWTSAVAVDDIGRAVPLQVVVYVWEG